MEQFQCFIVTGLSKVKTLYRTFLSLGVFIYWTGVDWIDGGGGGGGGGGGFGGFHWPALRHTSSEL